MNNQKPFKERAAEKIAKIKSFKNIEVIICIILIAVILLIYGLVRTAKNKAESQPTAATVQSERVSNAETKLASILSQISGAGNVSVLITYDGTAETVYAYDSTKNVTVREDNSGGTTLVTTTTEETSVPVFVTVDGVKQPLITKELSPKILGVVIVAEGASDIDIRLKLMRATAAALDIDEQIIEIFTMKK